jgi:hypothetical protein
MTDKYMNSCLASLAIKEMQVKRTQIPYHSNQNGNLTNSNKTKFGEDVEGKKPLYSVSENVN